MIESAPAMVDEQTNTLYFGDNLDILRESIASESIDLIYLDPPFNSQLSYNLLFKSPKGINAHAQIEAFEDTWHWSAQAEKEFGEILHQQNTDVAEMMQALRRFLQENDMMAYLTMITNRLLELRRILKPTGNLYLHCDSTASHYLKVVLDSVFGKESFVNEIIWQRTSAGKPVSRSLPKNTDSIFWYSKSGSYYYKPLVEPLNESDRQTFQLDDGDGRGPYNTQPIINPGDRPNLKYVYEDKQGHQWQPPRNGWRFNEARMHQLEDDNRLLFGKTTIREKYYLAEREIKGKQLSNLWTDIPIVSRAERLGYPTQKPQALLERIIESGSREGDTILDPFCGCGTAVHAAEKLKRQWIGIDITHLAISLIEKRLRDAFPGIVFEVHGTPKDLDSARDLAMRDKYQFQWWACSLVNAQPYQGRKKGADSGIDGLIFFQDDKTMAKKIVVSVKGGETVGVPMIRDLGHVVDREKAAIGFFVTLAESTRPMREEATKAGYYESATGVSFPKIQILTIKGLLDGTERPNYPDLTRGGLMFKKAKREATDEQTDLF